MERVRRALSNLSECKKIALKDLNGPGISDHDFLHGLIPLATFAGGFIVSALRAAMLSSIEMQHFEMRIGDLQAHPRFLALDMLLDLEQVHNNLRRLHISIDSKFNNPVQLQVFLKAFPNLSNFSLQVSSTVFRINSPGALESIKIPKLEMLSLDAVECTAAKLENFLFRHTEILREVKLIRISSIPHTQCWLDGICNHMRLSDFSMTDII
jgi:hypothetical protein